MVLSYGSAHFFSGGAALMGEFTSLELLHLRHHWSIRGELDEKFNQLHLREH